MNKRILLIIDSPTFSCKLLLPQKSAERLAKKIVKYHRDSIKKEVSEKFKGNKYKMQMCFEYSLTRSIKVEFKHI